MKYHNHILKKVHDYTIDKEMSKDQSYWEIWKDNKCLNRTLCLRSAKDYIDSNYNETYLV